jgi:c-di-GMP-related signal transduction protein
VTKPAPAPDRTPAPARTPVRTDDKAQSGLALRFLARHPIFTREEQVFGYELLFRDGPDNYFGGLDADAASRETLDSATLMGLDVLCGNRRAFVNCTREILIRDYLTLLPSNQAVAEIVKEVPPDDQVIAACQRLKAAGYWIALDDYVLDDQREPLTELADILKVNFRSTSAEQRDEIMQRHGPWRCRLLAARVETREEFFEARKAGFLYFQGYFFCQPEMLSTRDIPANRMHYVRMLQAVSSEELNHQEIETLIKSEAALCYRLLRYMNSASFGFVSEIHSVKHAFSLLGEREVRRWVRVVATMGAGAGKSSEVVLAALVRGRFCELLSPRVEHGSSDLFLMELFSLMDTILETPMSDLLTNVPVDLQTKNLLLTGTGPL